MKEAATTFCKSKIFDEDDISVDIVENEDPKSCFALDNPESTCEIVSTKVLFCVYIAHPTVYSSRMLLHATHHKL